MNMRFKIIQSPANWRKNCQYRPIFSRIASNFFEFRSWIVNIA